MLSALRCQKSIPLAELMAKLKEATGGGVKATLVDASAVKSLRQLQAAYELAKQTMEEGTAVSSRLEIEFLLWLGKTTHVQKAIERVGVKEKSEEVVLVCFDMSHHDAEKLAGRMGLVVSKDQKMGTLSSADEMALLEHMALSRIQD